MVPNDNYYGQSRLEKHPSMQSGRIMPNLKKKAQISEINYTQDFWAPQFLEDTLPTSTAASTTLTSCTGLL
jgi:hypothetical protein